ncbi:hypothetical protein GCM10027020_14080 [Nocardioides salsibiostraticola]
MSDAGPNLVDVDLFTDLEHSYNDDVEMTLESPVGTVVTLTTNNGGDNDDVFAGTTWDDDADHGNMVPYSTTPVAIVTDHVFTDGVTASRLVPEEALSAFANENPNGQWTLTIRDADHVSDTGTLDSWSLKLATRTSAETRPAVPRFSENAAQPVNETYDGYGVYSVLELAGIGSRIADTTVGLQLPHANSQDLEISLTSPERTTTTLTTGNGNGADNFADVVFDDHADPGSQVPYAAPAKIVSDYPFIDTVTPDRLVPEEAMGAFRGEDPNGDWILRIIDTNPNGLSGSLDGWSLNITPSVCDDEVLGLKAKTNRRLVKRWFVQAKIRVDEPAWIRVTGKAKAKGKGKRFFHVRKQVRRATPGYEQEFRMRLHPKVYRQMQRTFSGWARLNIKVTDAAGNTERIKKSVRIERKW